MDTLTPGRIRKTHMSDGIKLHKIGMGINPQRVRWADPPVDWKEGIPQEIRNDPVFEKYESPGDAYKALVGAQKFLGREHLPVPKDENDKEGYSLIFKKLGLPENADGYAIPTDLEIPKELPLDEEMIKDFKKTAHEHGILPSQFAGLYKWYMNSIIGQYNKINEDSINSAKDSETSLRKEWGAAYQQNITLAKKVFQQFADEKAFMEFEKGAGNNPVYLKLFANIGKILSEDQLTGKPSGLTMTVDEAQAEINKIKGDMKHAYWRNEDPMHQQAVEHMQRLMKLVTV